MSAKALISVVFPDPGAPVSIYPLRKYLVNTYILVVESIQAILPSER